MARKRARDILPRMSPIISFETPKHYRLQGLWLGSARARTVYIFVHGLYGNVFSQAATANLLSQTGAACLLFSNRGNGYVSKIRHTKTRNNNVAIIGGSHEVFEECRDDIAGAVAFAKSRGATRIILVGHSTGCQKSIWYLAGKPSPEVRGAVLLAPLSDYAAMKKEIPPALYRKTLAAAQKLARTNPHALLPESLSPVPCDAQRWLSLYTPESNEEIFTYASDKTPRTLRKTHVPLLALFASEDKYADRPAHELAQWCELARPSLPVRAPDHSFSGRARAVAKHISAFVAAL